MINPLDRERLRREFSSAKPFPFVVIDNFLDLERAAEISRSYPTFQAAEKMGRTFSALNEQQKVQITDPAKFPLPVQHLNDALAAPGFLSDLSYVTGIPNLLADAQLVGGGMHVTGSGGRLDVHVDFNYLEERKLHRRLNLLLYLNPDWQKQWGGAIELWDRDVKTCGQSMAPMLNRCVVFQTSEISYHGVEPVKAPDGVERKSFAAYYYTVEAPPSWTGQMHSTIFRARPDERLRGILFMPAEQIGQRVLSKLRGVKRRVRKLLIRSE